MNDLPVRKYPRLKNYDYSQNGAYFVTFCVKNKHELCGTIVVGSGFHARPSIVLTELGFEIQKTIEFVNSNDKSINIQKYIIMPNHVHMIICLSAVGHGNPTLQFVVGQIKSYTTKRWNEICGTNNLSFWQHSFHEHIIRNEIEYQHIWQYIDQNPDKWSEDKYYI